MDISFLVDFSRAFSSSPPPRQAGSSVFSQHPHDDAESSGSLTPPETTLASGIKRWCHVHCGWASISLENCPAQDKVSSAACKLIQKRQLQQNNGIILTHTQTSILNIAPNSPENLTAKMSATSKKFSGQTKHKFINLYTSETLINRKLILWRAKELFQAEFHNPAITDNIMSI